MAHDDHILIRIPTAEKRRLAEQARNRGISLSEFLRISANEAVQRTAA